MAINVEKRKNDALAIIDAALTILNKFPQLEITNTSLSYDQSFNPFGLLMDLFKSTAGYNKVLEILSCFITFEIKIVEGVVKTILISNIKNLLNCSINPFITDDLLRDGLVFDLRRLDLMNILEYSPIGQTISGNDLYSGMINNKGKYFYYGCDEFEYPDQLRNAKDFNAFLWYVKNRSEGREVWGQTDKENHNPNYKQRKEDGVITLEYHERSNGLTNAEGNGVISLQAPTYNCLHVLIGNCQAKEINNISSILEEIEVISKNINDNNKSVIDYINQRDEKINELTQINKNLNLIGNKTSENGNTLTEEQCKQEIKNVEKSIKEIEKLIDSIQENNINLDKERSKLRNDIKDMSKTYRNLNLNYYYKRTLIEFNYDYVTSLTLFDPKVVTAQLIDALTNCISIDLGVSYERLLIKNETKKLVSMIIESDDAVVDDCFFTFDNEQYNSMLQKAEMIKNGSYTIDGEFNTITNIDINSLLETLNTTSDDANPTKLQDVIKGSLTEISGMITNTEYSVEDKLNASIRMNFIENLLNNLAYVISCAVLSPKVYLLLAVNLKILGRETNFNINEFIAMFRNLLVSLIRAIRDELLKYLVNELMKIVGELAKQIAVKLTLEQAIYYADLMKRLIECFKSTNYNLDFTIDNVNYADIYEEDTQPENKEC